MQTFLRRRRLSSYFICCCGIATVLVAVATGQNPQRSSAKSSSSSSAREDARKTFESICAGCHSLDGHGGERGPDIVTRQEVRQHSDEELLEILKAGRPARGMPAFASLGNQKLFQLLAYLRTLQGARESTALPGDANRGKMLYFGKAGCSSCHTMSGTGGFLGNDLSAYGNGRTVADIRNAILNINKDPDPRSRVLVITLHDSRTLTGIARNEDNFTLQLQTLDGAFHFLNKSDIARIDAQPHTPMPSNYDSLLTAAEMDDLVKFLLQAGKENSQSNSAKVKKNDDEDNE